MCPLAINVIPVTSCPFPQSGPPQWKGISVYLIRTGAPLPVSPNGRPRRRPVKISAGRRDWIPVYVPVASLLRGNSPASVGFDRLPRSVAFLRSRLGISWSLLDSGGGRCPGGDGGAWGGGKAWRGGDGDSGSGGGGRFLLWLRRQGLHHRGSLHQGYRVVPRYRHLLQVLLPVISFSHTSIYCYLEVIKFFLRI